MQISCERCSTSYVLDDKLIPPGGAPVQCTKCGFVFTARPPAPPAPVAPAPVQPQPAAASAHQPRMTVAFGAPAAGANPYATQAFGDSGVSTPTPVVPMFGLSTGAQPTPPAPSWSAPANPGVPVGGSTLSFGGTPPVAIPPVVSAPVAQATPTPAAPAPRAVSNPSAPAARPTPSWVPPPSQSAVPAAADPLPGVVDEVKQPSTPKQPHPASQTMELQAAMKKRQRRLPLILGAVAGVAVVGLGVTAALKMRTPAADPALVAEDAKALALMKRDDEASLKKAIESWEALEAKAPDYVPVKANLMMAHVLLGQHLRDEDRRLRAQAEKLQKEMNKLLEKKEPQDWRAKANALRDDLIKIKDQVDAVQGEAARLDERAGELLKKAKALSDQLGPAGDRATVYRASALYYASKGNETAEQLAENYRKSADERKVLHDDVRAFESLALAGLQAQPKISGERRDKGVKAVEEALKRDPALLRAHLYLAKIYLANREFELARATVDKLLALNPEHKAAEKLKPDIDVAEADYQAIRARDAKAAEAK